MKKLENHGATGLGVTSLFVASTLLGACVGLGSTSEALKERRPTAAEAEARFEPTQTLIGRPISSSWSSRAMRKRRTRRSRANWFP